MIKGERKMKQVKFRWCAVLLVLLLAASMSWAKGQEEPEPAMAAEEIPEMTIKLGTFATPTDYVGSGVVYFMEKVKEKSGGKIQFDFLHSNTLGPEQGAFEMLGANTIQMFVFGFVSNQKFLGFYAPFLIKNFQHIDKVFKSEIGDQWRQEVLDESNVYMLGVLPRPPRQLTTTNTPVRSIKDIQGMKFRVPNIAILFETWKAFGADPVAMDFMQVYTSMQQGIIEGQDNPLQVTISYSLFEVQNYQMVWDYIHFPVFVNANADWWAGLPPKVQEIILESYEEAKAFLVEAGKTEKEDMLKQIEAKGLTIVYLSPEAIAEFRTVANEFNRSYLGDLWGLDILDRVIEIGEGL
jgi:TRAP-type C4-dicarboxylate transport system substrate-binding protein